MADTDTGIVESIANEYGVNPATMHRFRNRESGNWDYSNGTLPPDETPNSRYKGPFQFSQEEWNTYAPKGGNIYNLQDASRAMAAKVKANSDVFRSKYNTDPTDTDLYLIHNQGAAGYDAHRSNPGGVAWQNVARFYPNEDVAKSAIWGNIPGDVKRQRGWTSLDDVNKITSGDVLNIWKNKIEGGSPTAYQPKSYLGRISSDVKDYYNNIPASSGDRGPYNTIINGSNALIDGAIRTITRGQFGVADPLKAIGLPTAGLEQGIQDFHAAYPYGQAASDVGQFMGAAGPAGVSPSQISGAVSRGTQLANEAADVGATAFEDAAAAAGNPARSNIFVGLPPGPLYDKAVALRQEGASPTSVYNKTSGQAIISPSGKIVKEIPSSEAKVSDLRNFEPGTKVNIRDVYNHPQLFEEHPELANKNVRFESKGKERLVAHDRNADELVINTAHPQLNKFGGRDIVKQEFSKYLQYGADTSDRIAVPAFGHDYTAMTKNIASSIGRVEKLAEKTDDPKLKTAASEYVDQHKRIVNAVIQSRDFVDKPSENYILKQSKPFFRKRDKGVPIKDITLTEPEWREAVGNYLHDANAGNVNAMTTAQRSMGEKPGLFPFVGRANPTQMVYPLRKDLGDKEISRFLTQWHDLGPGRDLMNKSVPPAKFADGGRISSMDDSENTLKLSDLDDQDRYSTYRNRVEALKYLYPERLPTEKAPPLPERNPRGEAPGAHYGEYNPLTNRQYMAYADIAKKPEQIGGENSFERLGGGDANLGFLIHLHNSGNPQATNAIRAIHQGKGDAGFWVKHLTKERPGFADGGSVPSLGTGGGGNSQQSPVMDPRLVNNITPTPAQMSGVQVIPGKVNEVGANYGAKQLAQPPSPAQQAQQTRQSLPQPMNPTNQTRQQAASPSPYNFQNPSNQGGLFSPTFTAQVTNPYQYNPAVTGGAPAAFAEGGEVSDYRKGGRTRKINIPGEPSDLMQGRIAAQTHSSIGPYGGYIPPQLGAQSQQGSSAYADGGEVTDSPDGNAQIDGDGMVRDPADSGTTTDQIAAKVPEDSHVIPYSALVKLGDGDPELGKQRLLEYIKHLAEETQDEGEGKSEEKSPEPKNPGMKKGGKAAPPNNKHVDIMISNKELVLTPDKVKKIGGGDIERGHHELNKMRMKLRGAR